MPVCQQHPHIGRPFQDTCPQEPPLWPAKVSSPVLATLRRSASHLVPPTFECVPHAQLLEHTTWASPQAPPHEWHTAGQTPVPFVRHACHKEIQHTFQSRATRGPTSETYSHDPQSHPSPPQCAGEPSSSANDWYQMFATLPCTCPEHAWT